MITTMNHQEKLKNVCNNKSEEKMHQKHNHWFQRKIKIRNKYKDKYRSIINGILMGIGLFKFVIRCC